MKYYAHVNVADTSDMEKHLPFKFKKVLNGGHEMVHLGWKSFSKNKMCIEWEYTEKVLGGYSAKCIFLFTYLFFCNVHILSVYFACLFSIGINGAWF